MSRTKPSVRKPRCEVCAAELVDGSLRWAYCGSECAREARRLRRRVRRHYVKCASCRTRFKRRRRGQKYCSDRCRQAGWRRTTWRTLSAEAAATRLSDWELGRLLMKDLRTVRRQAAWRGGRQAVKGLRKEEASGADPVSREKQKEP